MVNNLSEMLAVRGLSVSEFARRTGIPQPTLHRIVNGKVNLESITAGNFIRVAHGLGLTADALYYGDMYFEAGKDEIDHVYATTSDAGRAAMVANARGVAEAYTPGGAASIPAMRDDMVPIIGC